MEPKIRIAILDDHQSVIDGYRFRLSSNPEIEVTAVGLYGEDLEGMLANNPVDVLLLDVGVPTSKTNSNPYPILHLLPKMLQLHPNLVVVIISMYNQRTLIRSMVDAGATGYILKDDQAAIRNLGAILHTVADGGIYFSQKAHQSFNRHQPGEPLLTTRQLEALSLCAAYPSLKGSELAAKICVANSTFRNALSDAYVRLGVDNRNAAVQKAQEMGLISPGGISYEGVLQASAW